ncbi:hypothetical protein [Thermoplasma sp. Kam2015]|uniref:hypothetical protein n=1 Tax=Thermoplasma sp. Kam2015 TaxID=2094122 RepID=UPI001F37151B|nr:hypothetical protein [Thermoplasma sp. Kam2015]
MFRTIKLKLPYNRSLIEAVKQFRDACQLVLDYGFDNRTFKFYPDSHAISLTTVQGRLAYQVAHSPLIDKYRGEYTNAGNADSNSMRI